MLLNYMYIKTYHNILHNINDFGGKRPEGRV